MQAFLYRLFKSVWLFPVILTLLLLLLTSLKINGSSLGVYKYILGIQSKKSILINEPRSVRSDEWVVNTQLTIAQKQNGFKRINPNIGNGQDMSVLNSAPYKDWPIIFKPELWSYFVMPFDNAFAFSWWFIGYLLILSVYFFVLKFLPNKRLWASLISTSFFFSPFIQWWYLLGTLASIYYSLFAALAFFGIMESKSRKIKILCAVGLSYVLVALALVLYPPFIVACAFSTALFCTGWLIDYYRRINNKRVFISQLATVFVSIVIATSVVFAFLHTRTQAVSAMSNTAYPGKRVAIGGGMNLNDIFGNFTDAQLQNDQRAKTLPVNQSTASGFIVITPFLLFLLLLKIPDQKNKMLIKHRWTLLFTSLAFILILLRTTSKLLDPLLNKVLSLSPQPQLSISFGLINIFCIVLFLLLYRKKDLKLAYKVAFLTLIIAFNIINSVFIYKHFPGYISAFKLGVLLTFFSGIIGLFVFGKHTFALSTLLIFSLISTMHVNPLYYGTKPLTDSTLVPAMKQVSAGSDGKWIAESIYFENFPQMYGLKGLSGTYMYPQKEIWKKLGSNDEKTYNRYAHVVFVIDHNNSNLFPKTRLELQSADAFIVATEPCSKFLKDEKVRYILAQSEITNSCVKLRKTVPFPAQTFFLYEIMY